MTDHHPFVGSNSTFKTFFPAPVICLRNHIECDIIVIDIHICTELQNNLFNTPLWGMLLSQVADFIIGENPEVKPKVSFNNILNIDLVLF